MATVGIILGATAGTAAVVGTAAVIGTVATVGSLYSQQKARSAQKKAAEIQNRSNKLQSQRGAINQVRQAQIARASALQQGENQGAGDSTAVAGAVGSIQSQSGGNIGFAQQLFGMQQSASRLMQSANKWQGIGSGISQLGNLGMSLASAGAFSGSGSSGSGTVMNDSFQGIGSKP